MLHTLLPYDFTQLHWLTVLIFVYDI